MAAGGWRSVGSACCLLARRPVVSVPFRLSSLCRSISWLVRLMRFGAVPRCCGYEFGGCHALPCVLPSSPIACCVSLLKRRGRRWLPRFRPRFYSLRFVFRLAPLPRPHSCACLAAGVGVSCLRFAYLSDTHIAPSPRVVGAERYCFPCRLFFAVLAYSSMMV